MSAGLPLVEELRDPPDVMAAARAFASWPRLLVMDSALRRPGLGRYSFLTADPTAFVETPRVEYGTDPFATFRRWMAECPSETAPGLPPFQGGVAGMLSYEAGRAFERLPLRQRDEFNWPDIAVGLYDWVIAWDHSTGRAWIISHGWPEWDDAKRTDRAAQRLRSALSTLTSGVVTPQSPPDLRSGDALAQSDLVPQFPMDGHTGLSSDFSRDGYLRAVERVIEYIHAGDIFQANLSQRLLAPQTAPALELFARLRVRNPATFAGYFAGDGWAIASASPERFVCVRGNEVETRPIKGTRRRRPFPEADLFTGDELRESEKDRAENVMIVDLLRNDLSRVCRPGSIRVPQLCAVETYETVQHLVSEIRGTLRPGTSAWDLLAAIFPGGSITGAPKVRAMEIIRELEPTVRGPYCGSLFYVGFDGAADSNLLIRTLLCRRGWVQIPAGGGIVAQSDPVREYEETLHKAEGMLRALGG